LALRAPGMLLPPRSPLLASVGRSWSLPREGEGDHCLRCLPAPGPGAHPWGPGVPAAAAAPAAPISPGPGPGPYLTGPPGSPPDRASRAGDQVGQREHRRPDPSPSKLHGGAQPWAPRDQAEPLGQAGPPTQAALGLECSGHHVLQEVRRARVGGAEAGLCLGPCSRSALRRG